MNNNLFVKRSQSWDVINTWKAKQLRRRDHLYTKKAQSWDGFYTCKTKRCRQRDRVVIELAISQDEGIFVLLKKTLQVHSEDSATGSTETKSTQ